ncbi:MAG: carboxypeptidase-like regulatory domain-containing protein [Bacteroidota bacterium]
MIFLIPFNLAAQVISGTVINSASNEPLVYASIGVIATDYGVTTNEQGKFRINVGNIPKDATVRISMIGYRSKTLVVSELTDNIVIGLTEEPTVLKEVLVKPAKTTQLGSNTTTKLNLTGWGGFGVGGGW